MKPKKYSTFKILTHEELDRLYSLPIDDLKSELDQARAHLYRHKNVHHKCIDPDRPFYVQNGNWTGVLKIENNRFYVHFLSDPDLKPIDVTDRPEVKSEDNPYREHYGLDFYYKDEEAIYNEIYKVHYNRSTHLYSADPNCEHEIEAQWSGIKCIHCRGWYCA